MIDCMILGDSIAVGIGMARPDCYLAAVGGINSGAALNMYLGAAPYDTGTVVISLGSNDWAAIDTEYNVYQLRKIMRAKEVIWIMPSITKFPEQNRKIRKIANLFGDKTIDIIGVSPDGVHPTADGYKRLSELF